MKKNKKFLVLAIAAALSAASAGSALALENQFTGAFTTFFDVGNFAGSGIVADDAPTANYFVQRVRLGYTAKADDHVKLVTKFEFDYNFWGNSSYTERRGSGGAIGADSVNMETKNLYLDLSYPAVNAKIGMMPYNDSFKGLLFDADMAGILLSHDYSNAGISAGYFRFNDSADSGTLGRNTNDTFSLDGKYNFSKDLSVGAGYYYIQDDASVALGTVNDGKVHSVGVNAATNLGPIALNGLFLQQFGDLSSGVDAEGYAFNVGAKMPLAGGTLRSEFLYVSGGNDAFYVANGPGYTEGGQFYDAEMTMLGRDKYATTIDNAIIYDVNNFNEGVIMGTVGYDYTFNDKVSGSANVGFASIADDAAGAALDRGEFYSGAGAPAIARGNGDYLGTEVNAEAYYKLSANVTLGARAGYVFLGDYFADSADDLYDMKLIAKYNF